VANIGNLLTLFLFLIAFARSGEPYGALRQQTCRNNSIIGEGVQAMTFGPKQSSTQTNKTVFYDFGL
jgi:hypothetical protein